MPANGKVLVGDLGAGRGVIVTPAADGSFSADVPSGPGATISITPMPAIIHSPPGVSLGEVQQSVIHFRPTVYARTALANVALSAGERSVAATANVFPSGLVYRFEGAVADVGSSVHVRGELRLRSTSALADLQVVGLLSRLFDERGLPISEQGAYLTLGSTPSGLPVEAETKLTNPTVTRQACQPTRESSATLLCSVDLTIPTTGLPGGGYAVRIYAEMEPTRAPEPADALGRGARNYQTNEGAVLTLLARGLTGPMRPATLLLVDTPAQSARGVQAVGDAAHWGWSSRIVTQPDVHVTPRLDAKGVPIRYVLEPYLPQVYLADRLSPSPPLIDLAPPGGAWKVTIVDPAGQTETLGPTPFQQITTRTATSSDLSLPFFGDSAFGGGHISGVARLATLNDAFRHVFTRDGLHRVTVEGSIDDSAGNTYTLGGTYEIFIAEPLDLDLGMLPGTPLSVGDYLDRAVQVHPPVPADVTYRFREWTGPDAILSVDDTTPGRASRFGWAHPHPGHPVRPTEPGEYRVDVRANYTDPEGKLWSASVTFGGVVVDLANALDVRGRRGIDLTLPDKARFTRASTGVPAGPNHLNFPYNSGDVVWQTEDDSIEVRLTVNDPGNRITPFYLDRAAGVTHIDPTDTDHPSEPSTWTAVRFAQGQGPLYSTTASGRDRRFGDAPDRIGYFYSAVERPGVRVREAAKEDVMPNGYWRFNDMYGFQPGMGPQGDRPNDYKFLFGGAIERVPGQGFVATGAYASFWIELPASDTVKTRVDSPFDPQATPILTFNGAAIRAFYDPTGTRPGSLLVEGDVADFGGYIVPLGSQTIFVNVTSPSGKVRSFVANSNPWGHLHDPKMNFEVDEAGIWNVNVKVIACPAGVSGRPASDATFPCVEGGLNEGARSYVFYVATKDAAPLPIAAPAFLARAVPLSLRTNGISSGGHATAWIPGWLLEARPLLATDPVVKYDPAALAARVSNLDWGMTNDVSTFREGYPDDQVTFTAIATGPDGAWHGVAIDAWGARMLAPG